jgi:D-serine deaminase-like pyridoxal phosphate-dependent protein
MNYERLREIFYDHRYPLALLHLEAFRHNLALLREDFQQSGKEMRLCTKSVRCGPLIEQVLNERFVNGVMIYNPHEAPFLAERYRARDILLGYPTVEEHGAEALCQAAAMEGTRAAAVADNPAHLDLLERAAAKAGVHLDVVVEVDVAYRPAGRLCLGVLRSPLRTPEEVHRIAAGASERAHLEFRGLMGYEAQNAATADRLHERLFKKLSQNDVWEQRRQVVEYLAHRGLPPPMVNGGGSGCYQLALSDPTITEVGVGSALYKPHLFDGFLNLKEFQPAIYFALQIVRKPAPDVVTCFSGGYISSGVAQPPIPALPSGLCSISLEGFGEVQTPLRYSPERVQLNIGDPIFCRPAKAGEPLERFKSLHLISQDQIVGSYPTYRGEGMCLG